MEEVLRCCKKKFRKDTDRRTIEMGENESEKGSFRYERRYNITEKINKTKDN